MKAKSVFIGCALFVLGGIVVLVVLVSIFFPKERTYTEAQLNQGFDNALVNGQDADNTNPMTNVNIDLQAGVGIITGSWEDGQDLTGEIVISPDGKSLRSQNVVVTNAGGPIVTDVLETVADAVIQAGLDNAVARQGQFKSARIEADKIIVTYR